MIRVRPMAARELCKLLSLSEFNALCTLVDEKMPPSEWVQDGPHTVRTLGKLVSHRFGVIRVERQGSEVAVFTDLGKGKVKWLVVPAAKKPEAKAA